MERRNIATYPPRLTRFVATPPKILTFRFHEGAYLYNFLTGEGTGFTGCSCCCFLRLGFATGIVEENEAQLVLSTKGELLLDWRDFDEFYLMEA